MEGKRVLAVDCDWRMRRLIRANLEAVGLEVGEAVDGLHGLQLAGRKRPDLVLLDLDRPGMDVRQFLEGLRSLERGEGVPVVVLATEPPERGLLSQGQVVGRLPKPFSAPALVEQVRQALQKAGHRTRNTGHG
jgi:two-component system, chemotaxis family, chemotaxis protein CheY